MAGPECNKIKTEARNAIYGKISLVNRNKCTVMEENEATVAQSYQWPETKEEGCW